MADWCRRDKLVQESGFDPKYFASINGLSAKDGGGAWPFKNGCMALDLDSIETDLTGNNDCTMDSAVGISKYDGQNHTQERFLLVEFRFRYKTVNNLDRSKMSRKVSHSRGLLAPRPVHGEPVFIFEHKVVGQAKRWVRNYSNQYSEMRSWKVMEVADFDEFVGTEADFPYIPVTNIDRIDKEIRASASDADKLNNTYQRWRDIALKFKLKYNLREVEAITNALHQALEDIVNKGICADPDVAALAQEDLALITK